MWPFTKKEPLPPLVYVGKIEFVTDVSDENDKHVYKVEHTALLFMNEDNRRSVQYVSNRGDAGRTHRENHTMFPTIEAWRMGGTFPKGLQYEEPLGEMLNRMIDARLTGKKP